MSVLSGSASLRSKLAGSRAAPALRPLGPVPWFRDGFKGLSVHATEQVPAGDDPIIRGALVRAVLSSSSLARLEAAVIRELRPLGYTATLRAEGSRQDVVHVEVTSGG